MQVKIVSVEAKNNLKLLLSYITGDQDIAPHELYELGVDV